MAGKLKGIAVLTHRLAPVNVLGVASRAGDGFTFPVGGRDGLGPPSRLLSTPR
jgi:hypothetical protein